MNLKKKSTHKKKAPLRKQLQKQKKILSASGWKKTQAWIVLITDETGEVKKNNLRSLIREIFRSVPNSDQKLLQEVSEVSVVFTSNKEIRSLNKLHRGKDKATDVLSFPQFGEDEYGSRSLGDIVVSIEKAKSQHEEYGTTYPEEVVRLIIHGLLHLLGYDHEKVSRAEVMRMTRLENRLFKELRDRSLV